MPKISSTRRSKKNPKIVRNLYMMKLRHVAVTCTFCDHLHSSADEIRCLNTIAYESDFDYQNDDFEGNYIDSTLWKERDLIVCGRCSDCLGGAQEDI